MRSRPLLTLLVAFAVALPLFVLGNLIPGGGESDRSGRAADRSVPPPRDPVERESRRQGDQLRSAESATRLFLEGYLPLIYGKPGAQASKLRGAAADLVRALRENPPRVPPAQTQLRPSVVSVSGVLQGEGAAQVTVTVRDEQTEAYPLILYVERGRPGGPWLVSRLGDD